jgi:hypothetical protein
VQGHQSFVSHPPLPEGGPIQDDPVSATSEAPEADESQDRDDAEVSLEEIVRLCRLLLHIRKNLALIRRESVSKSFFLRVPLLPKMRPGSPLLPILLKLKFSTLWTRKFC